MEKLLQSRPRTIQPYWVQGRQMLQLTIKHLRWIVSSRTQGRCLIACENVKAMVSSGVYPCRIRNYLHRWSTWWTGTAQIWQNQELLEWFLNVCWDLPPAAYPAGLIHHAIMKAANHDSVMLSPVFHATK